MAHALEDGFESSDPNEQVGPASNCQGQSLLIPGLPNDISLFCLARVPRRYHTALKGVCKSWRDLVCSDEWYLHRQKHHLQDTWIYALCKDKLDHLCCYVLNPNDLRDGWKRVKGLPSCCCRRTGMGFEVLGKKLYLFGGCGWIEDASDEMYSYDAASNSWSKAASLSVSRCYFASQTVDGKIIVIGGQGPRSCNPQSCDTYDPLKNCWNPNVDSFLLHDIEDSVVFDGKIYVRCSSTVSHHSRVVVHEPSSKTWESPDPGMPMGWNGPAVVVDGTLFALNLTSGTRLMKWEKDAGEWELVGRFSSLKTRPPCQLVSIGKKIFIIGEGLSTMIYDTENGGQSSRVLLSFSVPLPHYDADVVSCRSLTI